MTGVFTPNLRANNLVEWQWRCSKNLEYIRQFLWPNWTAEERSVFLNMFRQRPFLGGCATSRGRRAHHDDGHLEHCTGLGDQGYLGSITLCWTGLWAGRRLDLAAAEAEANCVADEFLNVPLFGAGVSATGAVAQGPRFKAYTLRNAAGAPALMRDAMPATVFPVVLAPHPGTVSMTIQMRCDDIATCLRTAADQELFAERVIRYFDFIGPNVAPAKLHRWVVGFSWNGQR